MQISKKQAFAVSSAVVIVAASALGLYFGEFLLGALAGLLLVAVGLVWYFHEKDTSQRSQGLAAALSALALLFGVYWYMIERPGAAKLDLRLEGQAFHVGRRQALILLTVEVRNVGNTPVSFEGEREDRDPDPGTSAPPPAAPPVDVDCHPQSAGPGSADPAQSLMRVRLGKVSPLTKGLRQRLGCATGLPFGDPVALARADVRPPVARVDQQLITRIEAGGSERYYYRAIVPCERRLVLAASARIAKRGTFTDALVRRRSEGHVWIAQSILDVSGVCGK